MGRGVPGSSKGGFGIRVPVVEGECTLQGEGKGLECRLGEQPALTRIVRSRDAELLGVPGSRDFEDFPRRSSETH